MQCLDSTIVEVLSASSSEPEAIAITDQAVDSGAALFEVEARPGR